MGPIRNIQLLTLSITLFTSCSKDDSQNQNPATTTLIKTETRDASPLFFHSSTYTYDNSNRLIYQIHSTNDSLSLKYNGNIIFERYSQFLAQEVDTLYYFLNSRNLIDSASFYNGEIRKKFTYNSEGYLTEVKIYDSFDDPSETESYIIQNGNLVYYEKKNFFDEIIESITYSDFDTSGKNTIGNNNRGKPYLGKSSTHFAKKIIYYDGSLETTYNTLISYDGSGRIIKLSYYLDTDLEYEDIYTYY